MHSRNLLCGAQKAMTRDQVIHPHCARLCPLPMKGHLLAPTGSFVPGEPKYPLPNVLQEGEQFLPVWSRRSLLHFVGAPGPELSFPPGAQATALLLWKSLTSKPQSLSYTHCLQRTWGTQFPCLLVCGPRGVLVRTWSPFSQPVHSLHLPPQKLPSVPLQLSSFSLPQIHLLLHTSHLPHYLPPTWRSFFQSSDWFPGCPKYSDLNTAVFDGKPRVPLLLCHLNSSKKLVCFK